MDRYKDEEPEMPTADLFTVAPHPHFPESYVLTENSSGGTLAVGTRIELIEFCKRNLAASVNIQELIEMMEAAEKARIIILHAPERETDFSVKRTIGDATYEIRLSENELLNAYMKQQKIGVMEDIRNYIEENEVDSDSYDNEAISAIADIYLDNCSGNTTQNEWGIQYAMDKYFETHELPDYTEEEDEQEL